MSNMTRRGWRYNDSMTCIDWTSGGWLLHLKPRFWEILVLRNCRSGRVSIYTMAMSSGKVSSSRLIHNGL
jgi:hypothetical protein